MQYDVEIAGKRRQVVITRSGHTLSVVVEGRTHTVDVARIDRQTLSLLVDAQESKIAGPRRGWEVSVVADPATGQQVVHVGAVPVLVSVNGTRRWGRKDDGGGGGSGPQRLVAPMPGKIVRVLAQAGDRVAARQPVIVVEAMKMENELRASREGTVAEIHVREGMSVEAGALLVIIQ